MTREIRFSLDELDINKEPRSAALLTAVMVTSVIAMLLEMRFSLGSHFTLNHAWSAVTYGAIPLVAVGWWETWRGRSGPILPALATALLAAPVVAHLSSPQASALVKTRPGALMVAAGVSGVLVLFAARRGDLARDWGLGLGDWRWWLPRTAVLFGLMLLMVTAAAWAFPEMRAFYPQHRPARVDLGALLHYQASMGAYMLAWEFFFRGFLLHGLARRGDVLMALYAHAIPFFLLHRGKPEVEMVASFLGSLGIGWFTLRSRSVLPAWILHWGMNLSMEFVAFAWRNYL